MDLILCSPALPVRLQEKQDGPAWAVLKPGKWRACTGRLEVTPEMLQQLAASYDPEKLDRAAFNFDHTWGGPALGWVGRAFVEPLDGEPLLWVVPTDLASELVEGIRDRRYERFSVELDPVYEPTGNWYLDGVAVLGNAKPAVKGLPKPKLTDQRYVIHLSTDDEQEPATPAEETPMTKPAANQPPPTAGDPPESGTPAPEAPTAPATTTTAATTDAAQLAADRAALNAEREAARSERLAARRERLEAAVARDLEQLGSRLTPAMRRAGSRDAGALASALLALRMADNGPTVKLAVTRDGQEATVELGAYDVVLAALRAAPEFTALGAGPMADADGDAPPPLDRRTAEQRSYDRGKGITDEQALATQARHPGAYGAPN